LARFIWITFLILLVLSRVYLNVKPQKWHESAIFLNPYLNPNVTVEVTLAIGLL